jgi:hypothetical protein
MSNGVTVRVESSGKEISHGLCQWRWSKHHARCRHCQTIDVAHYGKGLCKRCYDVKASALYRARKRRAGYKLVNTQRWVKVSDSATDKDK